MKRKNQILPNASLYSKDLICFTSINNSFKLTLFPSCLKVKDITKLNEKEKNYAKQNCSPVNILSTLSKIYEKACLNNCFTFLKIYFLSASLAVAKTLVRSNVL